jgi:protein-L-isoaspartate(D-aspartate) O-methyltransferase
MLRDTAKHQGQRRKLIELLISKGIESKAVCEAMMRVPRHVFFETAFRDHAYEDKAFPIAANQTISQPFTVARQSELLEVSPGMKVLEIGTGSGYQAVILSEMGVKVFSIERQKVLFDETKLRFRTYGWKGQLFYGDGFKGLPLYGPFDRIIVTAGAPDVPKALLDQLKPGGIMVIPVGEGEQEMIRMHKAQNGEITTERHGTFRFVPMLKDKT